MALKGTGKFYFVQKNNRYLCVCPALFQKECWDSQNHDLIDSSRSCTPLLLLMGSHLHPDLALNKKQPFIHMYQDNMSSPPPKKRMKPDSSPQQIFIGCSYKILSSGEYKQTEDYSSIRESCNMTPEFSGTHKGPAQMPWAGRGYEAKKSSRREGADNSRNFPPWRQCTQQDHCAIK